MSFFRFDPLYHSPLYRLLDSSMDASKDNQVTTQAASNGDSPQRQIWSPEFMNGPRIDVVEHPDHFTITAEVPGIKSEDVHLNVDEKTQKISISGSIKHEYHSDTKKGDDKKDAAAKEGGKVKGNSSSPPRTLISERMFGTFSRSLKLPDSANLSAIKAKMNAGILQVDIPKFEEKKKAALRRVTIEDVQEDA
jgi:HSP20 family protein